MTIAFTRNYATYEGSSGMFDATQEAQQTHGTLASSVAEFGNVRIASTQKLAPLLLNTLADDTNIYYPNMPLLS